MIDLDKTHEFPIGVTEGDGNDTSPPELKSEEPDSGFRRLIDSLPDIVLKLDRNGNITFVNRGALDLTGYISEELSGMNIADILPPEDLERFHKKMSAFFSDDPRREFCLPEAKLINRELGLIPIEIHVLRIGLQKEGSDLLFVARELTLRKKLERERLRRQKYELLSMLSHGFFQEIDATLTEITEEIQFVSDNLDPSGTAFRRLAGAIRNCEKGRTQIEALLGLSEPDMAGSHPASIDEIIEISAASVSFGGRIETVISRGEPLWPVQCDQTMLVGGLGHLIRNAADASPPDGKIEISARNVTFGDDAERTGLFIPAGEYVLISVQDHGHGIPDEYLDRIFDPFFSTRADGLFQGRGLGLTRVYAIVKAHRGYIDVVSKPEIRTCFSVYLPVLRKGIPEKTETCVPSGACRILLMDDEAIVRDVAGQMLRGLGYEVVYARDGAEAVTLYRTFLESGHRFDVLILDLNVKEGMGGRMAMRELLGIDPDVKGIISSGYSSDPEMMDYGRYGFKGVVGKPFQAADLKKILTEVIGPHPC